MPYPYGMQNSPVVGNGLGGLPRRATATTPVATTSGPIHLKQFGTPYTLINGSNWTNIYTRPVKKVSDTELWFSWHYYDQTNDWYQLVRATVSGDSITAHQQYKSSSSSDTYVSACNTTVSGGVLYSFYDDNTWSIYKYTPTRTAVTTTFPTTGTVTYGLNVGSTWTTGPNAYNVEAIGFVGQGSQFAFRTLSNGNLVVFRTATVASVKTILAHTINPSTGAIIASYNIIQSSTSDYHDGMSFAVIETATDTFSVFCMYSYMSGGTDPYVNAMARSVNFSANTFSTQYGPVYINSAAARSYTAGSFFKISDSLYRMKVYWGAAIACDFPCVNNVPSATPISAPTGAFAYTGMTFDPTYKDIYLYGGVASISDSDLPALSITSGLQVYPFTFGYSSTSYTNEITAATGSISQAIAKTLISTSNESSSSTWGPPYTVAQATFGRVSENAFFVGNYDRNGTQTRYYLQMVRATT